jgi:sulfotransferase family protein
VQTPPVPGPRPLADAARELASSASLYGRASLRVLVRGRRRQAAEERLVFVVGCPRSGTTFLARAVGGQPGFVDLGEVKPLKAAIPRLAAMSTAQAAGELRRVVELVRRLALVRHLRGVEQTPEVAFVLRAALDAYPLARALHIVRDGRDVVCSLLERGWLSERRDGRDEAGLAYGSHPRFWVEPESAEAFARLSDAGRAASAWRHYVTAARSAPERTLELRYEALAAEPAAAAKAVGAHLGIDPEPLREGLSAAHGRSVGRWRDDLSADQLADVEAEAGLLLRELGYAEEPATC